MHPTHRHLLLTINKNEIKYGENLYDSHSLRGGQNSLRSNPDNVIQESKKHNLYWSASMGKWGCNDCKQKGDRFDMQGACKGK